MLDEAVWAQVAAVLRDPEIIAREGARHREDGGLERALAAVEKQITSLADKQARIAKRVVDIEDDAVAAPLIAELKALAARKVAAEKERSSIAQRIADRNAEDARVRTLTDWCQRVGATIYRLTYSCRRLALETLGVQVTVYGQQANEANGNARRRWTMIFRAVS